MSRRGRGPSLVLLYTEGLIVHKVDRKDESKSTSIFFRRKDGFTLVEMVVVMGVIAILTGAVGISVQEVNSNTRLSNAASRALSDVRFAQELAMTMGREVDINVQVGADKYDVKYHTGSYVSSPLDGNSLIVAFNTGQYSDVTITSSGLGGRLSFNSLGEPFINGAPFSSETSVMFLNSRIHVVIYPSGYSCLEETVGGGTGCGGGC